VGGYRPIILLNTIGKVIESVMATRMNTILETYSLLPDNHISRYKGLSYEVVLYGIITDIYRAWQREEVAILLSLNISGAYDTVLYT
jgi:hypothetical protein